MVAMPVPYSFPIPCLLGSHYLHIDVVDQFGNVVVGLTLVGEHYCSYHMPGSNMAGDLSEISDSVVSCALNGSE